MVWFLLLFQGVQDSYYTYLVNTSTTLTSYSAPEMSSRRRFRDFVDLSKLLRENYRGYFVPPRPHRNMYQGKIRMSPTFIEQRRKALEKYLKQLTAHPVISRSQVKGDQHYSISVFISYREAL